MSESSFSGESFDSGSTSTAVFPWLLVLEEDESASPIPGVVNNLIAVVILLVLRVAAVLLLVLLVAAVLL